MHVEREGAAVLSSEPVVTASGARPGLKARISRHQVSVVAACLLGNMFSPTPVLHGPFGLFLKPIAKDFDWPRAKVSGVLSLLAVITALSYPVVGRLADRYGPRRLILGGNIAFGVCIIALGFARPSVPMFYGLFAIIGVVGSMPSTMMFNRVVSGWFDKARGTVLGLTSGLGNGTGATIMPFIALGFMSRFGWRGAFVGLGCIVMAIGVIVLFANLKEPPVSAAGRGATGVRLEGLSLHEAARTPTFWMLLLAIGLGAGCLTAVLAHVVPILTDRHFPVVQATLVVSAFAMTTAAFQIVVGVLLDRTGSPKLEAPLYLVAVAGMLILEHGTTMPVLLLGGILMGVGMGTEFGVLPLFVSRYFGLRRFGMIAGLMYSAVIVAQGVTPYLMDLDFDHDRTYLLSLHVIEGVLTVGAAVIACLPAFSATTRLWCPEPILADPDMTI